MNDLKAYILFPGAAKNPLYAGWREQLPLPVEIVKEYDTNWTPPKDAGILITHSHYRWEEISILRRIAQAGSVPVLILVDGILEYRNSFEHPDLADGSMFQPLIGHKVACIGMSQMRWIESWGNPGRCELVGIPRLDDLIELERKPLNTTGPFHLLVASARTPWFNDVQRESTFRAVQSIKDWLEHNHSIDGRPVSVTWRMNKELHLNLQLPGFEDRPGPVREVLEKADAIVTTPSTLQLEAAAMGLPVAVLDFHGKPQMTPLCWTIQHEGQVASTLAELANPPAPSRYVQDALLHDSLQLQEPAADRMSRLVAAMVDCGVQCRKSGAALQMPERILEFPNAGFAPVQGSAARSSLFPDNPVFSDLDVEHLKTELAAAVHEMGNYPEKYFQQRTINQKLRGYVNWLRLLIRNRAATIGELTAQIEKLKSDRPVRGE